jgi:hypothetical protein
MASSSCQWRNNNCTRTICVCYLVQDHRGDRSVLAVLTSKNFLEVEAAITTSVKQTLGSTGGTKLWHIRFVIIESGMALFAIQLVRVVLALLPLEEETASAIALDFVIGIHEVFNVV